MSIKYEFLSESFLEAMNDVGRYGLEKYGESSFQARRLQGDRSRGPLQRCASGSIAAHATDHFLSAIEGKLHDHFGTKRHQLAAAAFNAMMEFYFEGLEDEK